MSSAPGTTQRLFFALWPGDEVRARFDELAGNVHRREAGRRVSGANLHVTLVFLGNMPVSALPCLREAAARVNAQAFELSFDCVGHYRRPRVVWAGATRTPDALLGLVAQLKQHLRGCGVEPESRPYQAHLTLLRKVGQMRSAAVMAPITWAVGSFCLVRSDTTPEGARYEVLETWPLAG